MFNNLEAFIRVVRSLACNLSIEELGSDPTSRVLTEVESQKLVGSTEGYPSNDPCQWCTIGPSLWRSPSLLGRGTNVWLVCGYVVGDTQEPLLRGNEMVMKTAWRSSARSDIHKSIDRFPEGLAKFECGGDIKQDGYPITVLHYSSYISSFLHNAMSKSIKAIDKDSIHQITSGQVVIDLQIAVKELLENCLDAGATNVEVRFYQHGLNGIEIIDNGSGIAEEDYESIALKHHTSKLEEYEDLATMTTFGFRGEALSSLCALCEKVVVTTATSSTSPRGACLVMDASGKVKTKSTIARQQGATVTLTKLFAFLPVRRKEFERNIKREYGKTLSLLTAYSLGPCSAGSGVRLTVSNQSEKGQKTIPIKTLGAPCPRSCISALWGPKALDNIVDLDINFEFERDKLTLKRFQARDEGPIAVKLKGLISKFAVGCGRNGTDRQFLYINGRPCNLHAIQKAINEIYRLFNANQTPFVFVDFIIPTDAYDVNVSPDKRTILIHHEGNLITQLKVALEASFSVSRSTYDVEFGTQSKARTQTHQTAKLVTNSVSLTTNETRSPNVVSGSPVETTSSPPASTSVCIEEEDSSIPAAGSRHTEHTVIDDDQESRSIRGAISPAVVLHTSETIWGRRLNVGNRATSPARAPAQDGLNVHHPAKKKHRSDADRDLEEVMVADKRHDLRISETTPSSTTLKQRSLDNYLVSNKSDNLRTRLASFAMPGSQVLISAVELSNRNAEAEVDGLDSEGEVDELEEETEMVRLVDHVDNPSENSLADDGTATDAEISLDQDVSSRAANEEDETDDPSSILSQVQSTSTSAPSAISKKCRITHPEVIKTSTPGADLTLQINVERMKRVWSQKSTEPVVGADAKETIPVDAGLSNADDEEKAISALSRVIGKADFENMDVVGQFNLGFIIVRRRQVGESRMDDLFIVDQHAADEKYNFETLQETTKIETQKLFRPQYLQFTAADEILALENIDILKQNGFDVGVDETAGEEESRRLKLLSIPVSKSTIFDMKDLEEIVYLLHDRPKGQMVRCSKARSMFASRACRKSVMIGMPLTHLQMKTVIHRMRTMDQPWNCPHGRPTMRHLFDIHKFGLKPKGEIDWSRF